MRFFSFIFVFATVINANAINNSVCSDRNTQKDVLEAASDWVEVKPIPAVHRFMSYNENFFVPNLCCVSYYAEAVPEKPDCPAYRHVCVNPKTLSVDQDEHRYNAWCDY